VAHQRLPCRPPTGQRGTHARGDNDFQPRAAPLLRHVGAEQSGRPARLQPEEFRPRRDQPDLARGKGLAGDPAAAPRACVWVD